ncbi:MAG TPA: type III glutamate--ammonia ligase [Acidimicrobiales bacterium]|nr:type III glutamate--ammonia ligase [Acidimicrobiales bacterium]
MSSLSSSLPLRPETREDLVDAVRADGVEFVLAMFVDMHGKPCAKLVPASAIEGFVRGGAGFAGFAAGPIGQSPADPDLLAMPDPPSYARLPWKPEVAVVQCDPTVNGEPWPFAPRVILKRQLASLADRDLVLKVGAEVEYFLVHRLGPAAITVADSLDAAALPCYDARGLLRMFDHLSTVSTHLNSLGWANYANDHEDGNGQFKQNFEFADALTTADRVILFRYMVHALAEMAGMEATFMPKPFGNLTGSGMHTHLSLWSLSEGAPLFEVPAGSSDPRGLGLTSLAYQFIGGLLDHARSLVAVTCPTVNSYKRMGAAAPDSGASWAPAYAAYGGNNRTHMLRVPEPGRVENRCVDGSANPYLAFTVLAAAGLDGIDRGLDPGEPNTADLFAASPEAIAARGIVTMPPTLLHAVDALVEDGVLREALGKTPHEEYIDYFAQTKTKEFMDFHSSVTPWEIERYLTLM